MIEMEIQDPWWSRIFEGTKTVEGRKGTERWSKLKPGDILRCVEPQRGQYFNAEIIAIRQYKGEDPLLDYLTREGLLRTLPGVTTLTEGIAVYLQFSTPAEIRRYGMLAIEVRVVSPQ